MTRNVRRRPTSLRLQSLESRRVMAAAAFDLQIYSDDGGSPGALIEDNVVQQGDPFFLRITAQEFNPYRFGLGSASVDVDWDSSLLEVVATDLASTITEHLPTMRSGELNNDAGSIDDLSGTALYSLGAGRAIGNATAETFAMIPMQATDSTGTASIRLSESQIKTVISPSAELTGDQLRFAETNLTVVATSPTEVQEAEEVGETAEVIDEPSLVALETNQSVVIDQPPSIVVGTDPIQVTSADIDEPQVDALPELDVTSAIEQNADSTIDDDSFRFDQNDDGIFDFGDFGLLNLSSVIQDLAASAAAHSSTNSMTPDSEPFLESCFPKAASTTQIAAESWLDSFARAWLADSDARAELHQQNASPQSQQSSVLF